MSRLPHTAMGKVYLVGAGPGDPDLITLRGVQCLARADLVLHDFLVNPEVLRHAPPKAEQVRLGHGRRKVELSQQEINRRMVEAARKGQCVVRLKGGDPDVFARSADEIAALTAAGVPFETVPGVTAALAAAGYAGIPVTHSDVASAIALVTGQESREKAEPPLDYAKLADFPGTLVFYMGVASAPQWSDALISRGKSPETPVAIVRRCSWPDQRTVRCRLGDVVQTISDHGIRPPAVIIVGEVVALGPEVSWFAARPLFGQRVLVTRPPGQAAALVEPLSDLGAEVLTQPAIRITEPPDWGPVDAALATLSEFDWLVFSSANGVRFLIDRLLAKAGDVRTLAGVRIAAIGPGTADELAHYHVRADLVPEQYRAEALAEALAGEAAGRRFLLARASRGREVLAEQLAAAGGAVDQVVVYLSTDVEEADPEIAEAVRGGRIDWITVTSSAIARSLSSLFGEDLGRARLASISPVTSATLRQLGFEPAAEAARYTMDGLVEGILKACPTPKT